MRNTATSEFHLIVPGLLGPFATQPANGLQNTSDAQHQPDIKALQRSLSRAAQTTLPVSDYYSTLHYLLCPQQPIELSELLSHFDQLPLDQRPQGNGFYYLVEPVHFKAESDHAVLLGSELLQPQLDEAQTLVEAFNAHFAVEGISLHVASASRWYLLSERALSLELLGMDECLGRDIKHFMPRGDDALWWRRILNEAQMLFFEHPVNLQREQQQQLSINGLWLFQHNFKAHDNVPANRQVDRLISDNQIAQALCEFSDTDIQVETASEKSAYKPTNISGNKTGHRVLVDESFYAAACYGDQAAWQESLDDFCQSRFAPLENALQHGQISRLHIYPCDGRVFSMTKWQRYHFWKPIKSISHFFSQPDSMTDTQAS